MLEDDLKEALRPVDPPEGFERRVLARLDAAGASAANRVVPARRLFPAWAAAAGLACASLAGVAVYQQQRRMDERERALAARNQLVLALQITGKKLDAVRNQINYGDSNTGSEAQIH